MNSGGISDGDCVRLFGEEHECNRFTVGSDVDHFYEDAREAVEAAHETASDTYLESMTAQKMEALWEGG